MRRLATLAVLGAIFCISGASALIYQVAWQRILVFHSGAGIYSISVIVAAFLAGLGFGNYIGGLLSKNLSPRGALIIFAGLEIGVGAFALLSVYLFYDFLYYKYLELFSNLWRAGALHFLLLALPTTMMGMSLPFLTRATVRNAQTASRTIGYLYGINVLGAAAGALLAPWVLIRLFGIGGAVEVGAAGNLIAGLAAVALTRMGRIDLGSGTHSQQARKMKTTPAASGPYMLWLVLYTLSGFCAIALEILWFRIMDVMAKATAYTFGTVLALFLLGLGVGSVAGGPLAMRLKRPMRLFLTYQCMLLIYAGLAIWVLVNIPHDWPLYRDLFDYWGRYSGFGFGPNAFDSSDKILGVVAIYLVVPLFLFGPPTLLMGLSFGALQHAVQDDPRTSGFKVGVLQSGNIAGNVMGSLVAGLVLLHFVGTAAAFKVIVAVGLIFAAIGVGDSGLRSRFSVLGAALIAAVLAMPDNGQLWQRLHGQSELEIRFNEDETALVAVVPDRDPEYQRVSINGKGHSKLPYGKWNAFQAMLGVVPAAIHPAPNDVAVVGLGSGESAWGASFRQVTRNVTIYEITAGLAPMLEGVAKDPALPRMRALFEDPRVRIVTADGRIALATDNKLYDLIETDPLRPTSAYSGNLYSVEFYKLASQKLKPGGLMMVWAPTENIRQAFRAAFSHVVQFDLGPALLGSNQPIDLNVPEALQRVRSPRALRYLGADIAAGTERVLSNSRDEPWEADAGELPNEDLFPRDEFQTPPGW